MPTAIVPTLEHTLGISPPQDLSLKTSLLRGVSAKRIAADAHDAGWVSEFRLQTLQLMFMEPAESRSFGQKRCS